MIDSSTARTLDSFAPSVHDVQPDWDDVLRRARVTAPRPLARGQRFRRRLAVAALTGAVAVGVTTPVGAELRDAIDHFARWLSGHPALLQQKLAAEPYPTQLLPRGFRTDRVRVYKGTMDEWHVSWPLSEPSGLHGEIDYWIWIDRTQASKYFRFFTAKTNSQHFVRIRRVHWSRTYPAYIVGIPLPHAPRARNCGTAVAVCYWRASVALVGNVQVGIMAGFFGDPTTPIPRYVEKLTRGAIAHLLATERVIARAR